MFFSHFCHDYHQNYQNHHHNYPWNHHYHHQIKFRSYAQNVVFDVQKRGPSCPNRGQGGGGVRWFGQCPKENVFFLLMSSLRRRLSLRGSLSWPFWCLDSDSSLGFLIKRQKQLSSDREGRNGRGERCKEKAAKDDQAMSVHVQSRTVTLKEKCLNLVDRWKKIYCQV